MTHHSHHQQENCGGFQPDFVCQLLADDIGSYGIGFRHRDGSGVYDAFNLPSDIILRVDRLPDNAPGFSDFVQFRPFGELRAMVRDDTNGSIEQSYFHTQDRQIALSDGMSPRRYSEAVSPNDDEQATNRLFERLDRYNSATEQHLTEVFDRAYRECVAPDVLEAVVQFHPSIRSSIYFLITRSKYMLQLAAACPIAVIKLLTPPDETGLSPNEIDKATQLINSGAKLRHVTDTLRIPMKFREIAPYEAHEYLTASTELHPHARDLPNYWDRNREHLKEWAFAVDRAAECSLIFAGWAFRVFCDIGGRVEDRISALQNISDWVRACQHAVEVEPGNEDTPVQIRRAFTPRMSYQAAKQLSDEWHTAVREEAVLIRQIRQGFMPQNRDNEAYPPVFNVRKEYTFPPPPKDTVEIDGVTIEPIIDQVELNETARVMNNCAATYAPMIAAGECYLYRFRRGDYVSALAEVRLRYGKYSIVQLLSQSNRSPSEHIRNLGEQWVETFPKPEVSWDDVYATWDFEIAPGIYHSSKPPRRQPVRAIGHRVQGEVQCTDAAGGEGYGLNREYDLGDEYGEAEDEDDTPEGDGIYRWDEAHGLWTNSSASVF